MIDPTDAPDGILESQTLVLVGNAGQEHVGAHLCRAAEKLRLAVHLCDTRQAYAGPTWLRRFNWRLRGRRPNHLHSFSRQVVEACQEQRPKWLLSTGLAPIDAQALEAIGKLGVRRLNFLTDDPWNRVHRAGWFWAALRLYDHVFTPRRANIDQLRALAGPRVSYLPFAYAPGIHFPEPPHGAAEQSQFDADVVFAGGADRDRVPFMSALIRAGFRVDLYGGYWDRFPDTARRALGNADPATLRKATHGARIALCLVRRANRDSHVMRSFEVPAMLGCMLAEDTDDHRLLFGPDRQAVAYFTDPQEMVGRVRELLAAGPAVRRQLAEEAQERIVGGKHTYGDRLRAMLLADNRPGASR